MTYVKYNGLKCTLYKNYMLEGDGPLVKVVSAMDISKAYEMGFECVGYPTEVVKYLSDEEYNTLLECGRLPDEL